MKGITLSSCCPYPMNRLDLAEQREAEYLERLYHAPDAVRILEKIVRSDHFLPYRNAQLLSQLRGSGAGVIETLFGLGICDRPGVHFAENAEIRAEELLRLVYLYRIRQNISDLSDLPSVDFPSELRGLLNEAGEDFLSRDGSAYRSVAVPAESLKNIRLRQIHEHILRFALDHDICTVSDFVNGCGNALDLTASFDELFEMGLLEFRVESSREAIDRSNDNKRRALRDQRLNKIRIYRITPEGKSVISAQKAAPEGLIQISIARIKRLLVG